MSAFLMLLFPLSLSWGMGGDLVGNGGDGFLKDGHLVLRDLQESGLENSPVIGAIADPVLAGMVADLPFETSDDFQYLLARKLTDLNSIQPGFGDYLLAAVKAYSWFFIDAELGTVREEGDFIEVPPGTSLVQIANRLRGTIRINRTHWNQMDSANQVALVLHEVTFALLIPQTDGERLKKQSSVKAREIVGYFFSQELIDRGPALFNKVIKDELNINWMQIPSGGYRDLFWSLKVLREPTSREVKIPLERFLIPQQGPYAYIVQGAQTACAHSSRRRAENRDESVVLESQVQVRSFRVEYVEYQASFGDQLGLRLVPQIGSHVARRRITQFDGNACMEGLRDHLSLIAGQL